MSKIDEKAEDDINHELMIRNVVDSVREKTEGDAIGLAVASISAVFEIPAVIAEGDVDFALELSQYRPATDIYFACDNADDCRTLSIVWGIQAVLGTIKDAYEVAKKKANLTEGTTILSVTSTSIDLVEVE